MTVSTPDSNSEPRRGDRNDLETLIDMAREYCVLDGHTFDEDTVRNALVPLLKDDQFGVVWVVGRPADAYVVITWGYSLESGGADALVDEFYSRQRNQGRGSALMQHVINDLAKRGIGRLFLETEHHNESARRFYSRFGFQVEPSTWMSMKL